MVDALSTVKTLLSNGWNSSNTDNITPEINIIYEQKQVSTLDNDHVLIYEVDEKHDPDGIGGKDYEEGPQVSIDIRTSYKRAAIADIRPHLVKIKDEIIRIVRVNVSRPDNDYCLIYAIRKKDLSNKTIGMGRMIIDVQLKRWVSL